MSKTNGLARKVPTHFETVPLEVVKVIAVADLPLDQIDPAEEIVPPVKKRLVIPPFPTRPVGRKR